MIGVCIFGFITCLFGLRKNDNTYKNRMIIINAVYEYIIFCHKNNIVPSVDYEDMESYDATDRRFWDWGYTKILPEDKYELVKPFIK